MVHTFGQGVMSGPFNDSLIRNPTRMFGEIRRQVVAHIAAKEVIFVKCDNTHPGQARHKGGSRAQPLRVHEAVTEKRSDARRAPYTTRKNQPRTKTRDDLPFRPKFRMTYKELLGMLEMAEKLRFPPKSDRNLGSRKEA